ncbi:MAG: FAD-dependent oxidoreductase [Anaerolineae bacterium]
MTHDVLVIGGGLAGMTAALRAAQAGAQVRLLARAAPGAMGNSAASGGGLLIAGPNITRQAHYDLTLAVGHGINEPSLVDTLSRDAPACREWLEETMGFKLSVKDKGGQGYFSPGGGALITAKVAEAVAREGRIEAHPWPVRRLLTRDGAVVGALVEAGDGLRPIHASATVLATGGYAGLFARHDNPGDPMGAGVVMAARAGARVRDLEFVQFYPIATAEPSLPTFMLFRPFAPGARLLTQDGHDLLAERFGGRSLNEVVGAARDDLSRIVHEENARAPVVFDATGCDWSQADKWFSLVYLRRYDWDWEHRPARVAPIAHHCMGGVAIDAHARTSLARLFAAGEVAAGVHGANRHGSNSLTDCLVFGCHAGDEAAGVTAASEQEMAEAWPGEIVPERADFAALQRLVWEGMGIVRDAAGMARLATALEALAPSDAQLMAQMALAFARRRTESRGAHIRADYPAEDPAWAHSQVGRLARDGMAFEPTVNG